MLPKRGAPARRHMKYGGYMQNNILIKENMLKKNMCFLISVQVYYKAIILHPSASKDALRRRPL